MFVILSLLALALRQLPFIRVYVIRVDDQTNGSYSLFWSGRGGG